MALAPDAVSELGAAPEQALAWGRALGQDKAGEQVPEQALAWGPARDTVAEWEPDRAEALALAELRELGTAVRQERE